MNSTLLTSSPVENNTNVDRAELHNAEVEPIAKKYLELRYRLLPFNYTLAREAADTGLPMMRALWLRYPGDSEAVKLGSEYLWGRDLLVAPVVEKGCEVAARLSASKNLVRLVDGRKTRRPALG